MKVEGRIEVANLLIGARKQFSNVQVFLLIDASMCPVTYVTTTLN